MGVLQAHGVRAAAVAAGDRAARDGRRRVPLLLAGVGVWALVIGPFVRQPGRDRSPRGGRRRTAFRLRPDRAAARRYLRFSWPVFVTSVGRAGRGAGPDRGVRARRRARRRRLDHARGDADPLRRPRRPDPRDDDLPRDRARPRPRRRARGAVREGQPADADVGVPVRRRPRAVRRRPDRVRARRRLARARSCCSAAWRSRSRCSRSATAGSPSTGRAGESWPQAVESAAFGAAFVALAIPGALLGGSWGFVAGRVGCTALRARRAPRLRAAAAARACGSGALALRAAVPVALASAPVLALRLALWGGERTLAAGAGRARAVARRARRWRRTGSRAACSPSCAATCAAGAAGVRRRAAVARAPRRSPASRCAATSGRSTRAS